MVSIGIYVSGCQPSGALHVHNPRASFPNGQKRPSGAPFALGWYVVGPLALRDVALEGELFSFAV
jgi:hypothetical protein